MEFNKVIVSGNLTKDLEIKKTNNGKSYLKFTIASNRDKDTTYFINCVAWNKTAELIANYHRKGDRIGLIGSIVTGSYESQNGKVYTTEVLVDEIIFMKKNEQQQQTASAPRYEEQNIIDAPPLEDTFMDTPLNLETDDLPFY